MTARLAYRELSQNIQRFPIDDIEKSIAKYAIETINLNHTELNLFANNYNESIVSILRDNKTPICFDMLNVLFENLLDKNKKTELGIIFTPKYITDFICKETFSKFDSLNEIKIIDPCCGCGIFLISAIEIIKKQTQKSIKDIIKNQIFGLDIDKENIKKVVLLLKIMGLLHNENIEDSDINIKCCDSLATNWNQIFDTQFDCIIGNPPYVNPHSLPKQQAIFLKQNFKTTSSGVFNIFYAFIELGIKFLKPNGFLSYIVPNNFFTISAAKTLRDFIEPYLCELIDFKDNMIFKPTRTYNAIITLTHNENNHIKYTDIEKTSNIQHRLNNITYKMLDKNDIFADKWRFLDFSVEENIKKIENQFFVLKPFINTGIATLKDEVYRVDFDGEIFFKKFNGKKYIIDFQLIKPIYKIPEIKNSKQNGYFIFPYTIKNNVAVIIDEATMQNKFSNTYNYLLARKYELDLRDKGKTNPVSWYAYGRTQGLNKYGKKLLFSTFGAKPSFMLIEDKTALFCNGYAVFENDIIELEILQKVLNSRLVEYYIKHTSYQIEGGYYCYQKKYLEKFSIPYFDSKEKEFLLKAKQSDIDTFLLDKYEVVL
ncbi:HsdM family class I SAM-dependent methyltransferase [Helicobacter sp. 23-1046]